MPEDKFITDFVIIRQGKLIKSGKTFFQIDKELSLDEFLKKAYTNLKLKYPKFHKMNRLSKLGFLGTELLLKNNEYDQKVGLVFSNSASSLDTDIAFDQSLSSFASPSIFVYTLPNIMLGEISIRHQFKSENAFFISKEFDPQLIINYSRSLLAKTQNSTVVCGWVDLHNNEYDVFLCLISSRGTEKFSEEALTKLYTYKNE